MRHREVDGFVGISNRMELLIAVLDSKQNLGGVDFIGRWNFDRLEATLERTIFLNRLAILTRSGRANALNLSA